MLEAESSTSSPDVKRVLEVFRVRPPGNKGHARGSCEGCGRFLWSEGIPPGRASLENLVQLASGAAEEAHQQLAEVLR